MGGGGRQTVCFPHSKFIRGGGGGGLAPPAPPPPPFLRLCKVIINSPKKTKQELQPSNKIKGTYIKVVHMWRIIGGRGEANGMFSPLQIYSGGGGWLPLPPPPSPLFLCLCKVILNSPKKTRTATDVLKCATEKEK